MKLPSNVFFIFIFIASSCSVAMEHTSKIDESSKDSSSQEVVDESIMTIVPVKLKKNSVLARTFRDEYSTAKEIQNIKNEIKIGRVDPLTIFEVPGTNFPHTFYQFAMEKNNIDLLKFFKKKGVDFNTTSCIEEYLDEQNHMAKRLSCIEYAQMGRMMESSVIDFLLKNGVSPNKFYAKASPLFYALMGSVEKVHLLLKYNANIHSKDPNALDVYQMSYDVAHEQMGLPSTKQRYLAKGFSDEQCEALCLLQNVEQCKETAQLIIDHDGRIAAQAYVLLKGRIGLPAHLTKNILEYVIPNSDAVIDLPNGQQKKINRKTRFNTMTKRKHVLNALARARGHAGEWLSAAKLDREKALENKLK